MRWLIPILILCLVPAASEGDDTPDPVLTLTLARWEGDWRWFGFGRVEPLSVADLNERLWDYASQYDPEAGFPGLDGFGTSQNAVALRVDGIAPAGEIATAVRMLNAARLTRIRLGGFRDVTADGFEPVGEPPRRPLIETIDPDRYTPVPLLGGHRTPSDEPLVVVRYDAGTADITATWRSDDVEYRTTARLAVAEPSDPDSADAARLTDEVCSMLTELEVEWGPIVEFSPELPAGIFQAVLRGIELYPHPGKCDLFVGADAPRYTGGSQRYEFRRAGKLGRLIESKYNALTWLAHHVSRQGSLSDATWSANSTRPDATPDAALDGREGDSVEATALAYLSFTGNGYSSPMGDAMLTLSLMRDWLLSLQGEDGVIGDGSTRAHSLALEALSEDFGLDGALALRGPLERAAKALGEARIDGAGWGEEFDSTEPMIRATCQALCALRCAELADISRLDDAAKTEALAWLGAQIAGNQSGGIDEAAVLFTRLFVTGDDGGPKEDALVGRITKRLEAGDRRPEFLFWSTHALRLRSFADWEEFARPVVNRLVKAQHPVSPGGLSSAPAVAGSWDPPSEGPGRVTTTALNVLTLTSVRRHYIDD